MRRHWIDNLRWVTVLLVLFYHVIYFYNGKGVFGGIGGFGGPQYQDVVLYILYPWFMPLLFLLAGVSARYSLERRTPREFFRNRTRKLLVPGTLGLFVFHWMVGYFNTVVAAREGVFDGLPAVGRYLVMVFSGIGPLWFVQVLWLLCVVLLAVRALDRKDRFWSWCGKAGIVWIILLGVLFWAGEHTLIQHPREGTMDGLYNLYKPLFYLIPFLMGYFVFSHDAVQERVAGAWIPLMACAAVRHRPGRDDFRTGQHHAPVSRLAPELPLRLADVPGHDGLVQGAVRPDGSGGCVPDEEQLRHLHHALPGRGFAGVYDEDLHFPAPRGDVSHPGRGGIRPLAGPLRVAAAYPGRPLVRIRGMT